MLLNRFGGFLLLAIYIAHFTGATGVSRPEYVNRADQVGIGLETAGDAGKALLCRPVLRRDRIALRTSPARVPGRHEDQLATLPGQFVL